VNRRFLALRMALGGAVCGCFAGALGGGLGGLLVGSMLGNLALGLDAALVAALGIGLFGGVVGWIFGCADTRNVVVPVAPPVVELPTITALSATTDSTVHDALTDQPQQRPGIDYAATSAAKSSASKSR